MSINTLPVKVMIAGIGGASLGTEIIKSLNLAGNYEIYGCDISTSAYGLYEPSLIKKYLIEKTNYVQNVLNTCLETNVKYLIPGGEQPMMLLCSSIQLFKSSGITILSNSKEVTARFSDKEETFKYLEAQGIAIPKTIAINKVTDLKYVGMPCIVKPATGSGGSTSVFFAINEEEAMVYAKYINRMGSVAVGQEYIDDNEGEFTIGVLSLDDKKIVGSIALRRTLDAKLSVAYRGRGGLISSGYSQGFIDKYSDLCIQAERIALAIESRGPINIQGRIRNGILFPFEINPRFSASTYLRAIAGFNEIDTLIKYLESGEVPIREPIKTGWYLRSLTEQYISPEDMK